MSERDTEARLAELAAYHVGLFSGVASRIDASPVAICHALFLLIEEAKLRRDEWMHNRRTTAQLKSTKSEA
jgi:hypothetical protein